MKRKASAVWKGGLKDGKGTISTDSGVLSDTRYSFSTRFEQGVGTNPEELIAAAHAGCFSTTHRKLVQRVVDFDRLAELGEVPRVDDVFCCLGTTMKHAGSEEAFRWTSPLSTSWRSSPPGTAPKAPGEPRSSRVSFGRNFRLGPIEVCDAR